MLKRMLKKVLAGLLLFGLVSSVIVALNDGARLLLLLQGCRKLFLAWALAAVLATFTLRFLKWHLLLAFLPAPVQLGDQGLYFLVSMAFWLTPGKMGEVVKLYFLKQSYAIDYHQSLPLAFGERLSGLLGSLLLFFLVAAKTGQLAGLLLPLLCLTFLVVLFVLVLAFCPGAYVLVQGCLLHLPYVREKMTFLDKVYGESRFLLRQPQFYTCVLLSTVYWFLDGVTFWCVVQALAFPLSVAEGVFILVLTTIIGGLTLMPGAVGVLEAGMLGLLLKAGMDLGQASLTTLLYRFLALLLPIICGSVAALWYRKTLLYKQSN